jgi:hypothetical protein
MIGGCGRVLGNTEIDSFYISKLLKKEEEEIYDLFNSVHHITQDKLEEVINYVQEKIEEALRTKEK